MKTKLTLCALALALTASCAGFKERVEFENNFKGYEQQTQKCREYVEGTKAYEACRRQYLLKFNF